MSALRVEQEKISKDFLEDVEHELAFEDWVLLGLVQENIPG